MTEQPLVTLSVSRFIDVTASNAPAPGGGSVSALVGSLACALAAMVGNLTLNKKKYEAVQEDMTRLVTRATALMDTLRSLVDEDTEAFNRVMAAFALPKNTDSEKQARAAAIQQATIEATQTPLRVLRTCAQAVELVETARSMGNVNALSDTGVAAALLRAGAEGASLNIMINLGSITDQDLVDAIARECRQTLQEVQAACDAILDKVRQAL